MAKADVVVDGLWKTFRIYHQRSSTLKQAIVRRGKEEFEEFWALRDVSFEVPAGTTFGLIGANGAGKSTMLKVLSRILVPDKGSVKLGGRVSALLELGAGFHPELSGRENVFLNGTILGMTEAEVERKFDEIVAFSGLEHAIDNAVKTYSSGMQARLGFAVAVSIEPEILIIDEVLAVGDEQFQRRCLERMAELRAGGRTCIFVSHSLGQVQQICERVVWLDKGRLAEEGNAEEVIASYLRSVSSNVWIDAEGRDRMGTGEVRLDVEVLADGAPTTWVELGSPATFRISWTCEKPVADVVLEFRIHSAEGIVVAGEQIRDGALTHLKPGAGHLEYKVPRLSLLPGAYHISASVQDRHGARVYDSSQNLVSFDVAPRDSQFHSLGYVTLDGAWGGTRVE
jgi:ABC-2 type transport system ATP-binding protein